MFCRVCLPVLGAVLLSLSMAIPGLAVTYSGSLGYTPPYPADSGDGLFVGPSDLQWHGYSVGISWTVTNEDNSYSGYPWKYTYTFGHNGGQSGISHIIIEASQGIAESDIAGLTNATISSVGEQRVTSGNPSMPEDINGLRFNPVTTSPFNMTWTFWSNRAPVWGDFYARCGGGHGGINFAYNYNNTGGVEKGFLDPNADDSLVDDVDPTAPASNNSVDFHILRPDSVVPEPSALLALLSGLGVVGGLMRRRRKQ